MPLARIIAFDTSGPHCLAAYSFGDADLVIGFEEMKRGQAERLIPLIETVLQEADASWNDVDALAVGTGPGNFTGIRIAVSAARGLALGLSKPVVGLSSFEIARAMSGASAEEIVLPGARDTLYRQKFDATGAAQSPEILVASDQLCPDPIDWARAPEFMVSLTRSRLASGADIPRPAPLYVRAPNAAPASDLPPAILS